MKVGETFGRFEVIDLLQKGGMGEIYVALDTDSHNSIALKILAPEYHGNDYIRGRFLAEAESYRRLSHPNIVRYIDSGEIDGRLFIALEHIEGIDLAQLINRDGPLEIDLALSIMIDVTYAVNYAHSKEIIHRDLKPQNIMVTHDNVIKLIDFGVAHARNDYVNTDAGMVLGSLCYNSPEQNQGKLVDYRSDIYSLGLVFYEIVTARRVLPNTSVSDIILSQVELDHTVVPPRFHNENVTPELQDLILKMFRFHPNDRYQKLETVLLELKELGKNRAGNVTDDARKAKALADRDLADTHYWKGMNFLSEGKYFEALEEFEALLNLSLYHHQAYIAQVEEQVNFLSWTLDLCAEGASSPEDEIKSLELDVLKQLSAVYSANPNNGIRKAMRSLLSFYKDGIKSIRERRQQQQKERKIPISPEEYPVIVKKLADLYSKLGRSQQRHLMEAKILTFAERMNDKDKALQVIEELRKDCPDDNQVRRGYVRLLFKKGEKERALKEALELGKYYRDREEYGRALTQYKMVLEQDPDNRQAKDAIEDVHQTLARISEETENLVELTQKMVEVSDYNAAINMCSKFLNEYPDNNVVLSKLADLYEAKGKPQKAKSFLLRLGIINFDRGRIDKAKDILSRALRLAPDCQDCINYLVEIFKSEDPSFCDKTSSKAIVEALYLRLGMYEKVISKHKAKLKGSLSDLRIFDRIIEIYEQTDDTDGMLETIVDKIICTIEHGDDQAALETIDRFTQQHPEELHRLERLKKVSFEARLRIKDQRLKELVG